MIAPHLVAPWAALAARDRSGAVRGPIPDCGRDAPVGTCDVLHSCCRLPYDPARYARRRALDAARGAP